LPVLRLVTALTVAGSIAEHIGFPTPFDFIDRLAADTDFAALDFATRDPLPLPRRDATRRDRAPGPTVRCRRGHGDGTSHRLRHVGTRTRRLARCHRLRSRQLEARAALPGRFDDRFTRRNDLTGTLEHAESGRVPTVESR